MAFEANPSVHKFVIVECFFVASERYKKINGIYVTVVLKSVLISFLKPII